MLPGQRLNKCLIRRPPRRPGPAVGVGEGEKAAVRPAGDITHDEHLVVARAVRRSQVQRLPGHARVGTAEDDGGRLVLVQISSSMLPAAIATRNLHLPQI